MFEKMDEGNTIKNSFNLASAQYPLIASCVVFVGDENLIITEPNYPPNTPSTPSGPPSGEVGIEYTYNASTTDSDGDDVYYLFDWGDYTNSGWVGPYNSGENGNASHAWTIRGTYQIKVKAKDSKGAENGVWSDPLAVTMPKNKAFNFNFDLLEWLFERFPYAFPILRYLLGL